MRMPHSPPAIPMVPFRAGVAGRAEPALIAAQHFLCSVVASTVGCGSGLALGCSIRPKAAPSASMGQAGNLVRVGRTCRSAMATTRASMDQGSNGGLGGQRRLSLGATVWRPASVPAVEPGISARRREALFAAEARNCSKLCLTSGPVRAARCRPQRQARMPDATAWWPASLPAVEPGISARRRDAVFATKARNCAEL